MPNAQLPSCVPYSNSQLSIALPSSLSKLYLASSLYWKDERAVPGKLERNKFLSICPSLILSSFGDNVLALILY